MATAQEATSMSSGALDAQKRSANIQREQIKRQEEQRRLGTREAMARKLNTQGFGAGSGFQEAAQARMQTELQRGEQQRLADVDIAQAQSEAALREAQAQREQQESQFGRQFGLSREQLAQQQQQFERGLTAEEQSQLRGLEFQREQLSSQESQFGQQYSLSQEELYLRDKQFQQGLTAEEQTQLRSLAFEREKLSSQESQFGQQFGLSQEELYLRDKQFQQGLTAEEQSQLRSLEFEREQLSSQQQQFGLSLEEQRIAREQGSTLSYVELAQQKDLAIQQLESAVTAQDKDIAVQQIKIAQEAALEKQRLEHDSLMNSERNSLEYQKMVSDVGVQQAERDLQWRVTQFQATQQQDALKQKYEFENKQLDQQADQWLEEMDLSKQEASDAKEMAVNQLLWEKDKYSTEYDWREEELLSNQSFQLDMMTTKDKLETGQILLQEEIQKDQQLKKLEYDALYNRGFAGEVIDTAGLSPSQKFAYQAGTAKMSRDEFDQQVQMQADLRNNLVINAADPEMGQRILDIYRMYGIIPGGVGDTHVLEPVVATPPTFPEFKQVFMSLPSGTKDPSTYTYQGGGGYYQGGGGNYSGGFRFR